MSLSRRAYLGAELPPDAEAFTDDGLRLAGVLEGGMAHRAGLAPGDTITAIAGVPIRTLCDLAEALRVAGGQRTTTINGRAVEVTEAPLDPGVIYGEHAGLRTLVTRSPGAKARVLVIQGIACESVEGSPYAELCAAWAAGGIDTARFDKRGVGDSPGTCTDTDFTTELADARAMVEHFQPSVVFGHSVGGIIAPLVARCPIITYGAPVERWLACLRDSVRRQLVLRGASPETIEREVAAIDQLRTRGELNGRSATYHAQLDTIDIAAAWRTVTAPVLVARGEHDWVVRADDQARIAKLARGPVTVVDLPGLDHLVGRHADREASLRDYGAAPVDAALAAATVEWITKR